VTVLQAGEGEGLDSLISVAEAFEKSQQPDFNDIASPLIDGTDTERLLVKICVLCCKALLGRNALGRHMKNAHPKVFGPYPCPQEGCHKLIDSGTKMVTHMALHSMSDSSGSLKCGQCDFSCGTAARLNDHIKKIHTMVTSNSGDTEIVKPTARTQAERLNCNADDTSCKESFATALQFIHHMRSEHGLPPWRCELCSKRFQDRQNYRFHSMSHGAKKNFTCDICTKSYNNPRQLYAHRSLHLGKIM
jgi:KRAB domain-containing zinc finger protein